jgi:hypothetical protein
MAWRNDHPRFLKPPENDNAPAAPPPPPSSRAPRPEELTAEESAMLEEKMNALEQSLQSLTERIRTDMKFNPNRPDDGQPEDDDELVFDKETNTHLSKKQLRQLQPVRDRENALALDFERNKKISVAEYVQIPQEKKDAIRRGLLRMALFPS